MVVTYVMVAVCVVGVLGAVASVLSYDNSYSKHGSEMRIPKHSRRGRKGSRPTRHRQASRPSRQLQAVEAALAEDAATDPPTPAAPSPRTAGARRDERPAPRRRGDAR